MLPRLLVFAALTLAFTAPPPCVPEAAAEFDEMAVQAREKRAERPTPAKLPATEAPATAPRPDAVLSLPSASAAWIARRHLRSPTCAAA